MDIVRKIEIKTTAQKVYEAITTAAGIHGWWAHNSAIGLKTGMEHIMYFVKQGQAITMKFRIDEMENEKRLAWTCTENDNPAWVNTTISFDLREDGAGTQLRFSHIDWDDKFKDTPLYTSVPSTWDAFMSSLKSYCETGVGQPW